MASADVLRAFCKPRGIALVGASAAPHKAGGRRWLSALETGSATLYPISMSANSLNGRKAYRSVRDVPGSVDLGVIMVPGDAVAQAVADCAAIGAKAVVVISAGFGETSVEGRAAEEQMVATLRAKGARMLGPNSAGVFSANAVNCLGWSVPAGAIGLITQSGNMALSYTLFARTKQVGFSRILAIGNGADLRLSELTALLFDDEDTRAILIYCEGFAEGDGRALAEVVRKNNGRKPVVLLKPGASEAGRRAAHSHTGALAGDDAIADAALTQAGIIRAREAEEAFDIARALSTGRRLRGRAIAVLSDGGGHATIVSDCAGRHGLTLARLAPETIAKLQTVLPVRSGLSNPVDFAGVAESDPASVPRVLRICRDDPNVDGLIFAGHFGGYHLMTSHEETQRKVALIERDAAADIAAASQETTKPIIVHSDHAERGLASLAPLHGADIPLYAGLEAAAKAMAALARGLPPASPHPRLPPQGGKERIEQLAPSGPSPLVGEGRVGGLSVSHEQTEVDASVFSGHVLLEPAARARLAQAGIAMPRIVVAANAAEAGAGFKSVGGPVALKLVSDRATHKSDVGGVLLGLDTEAAVRDGFARLVEIGRRLGGPAARVLVAPMIAPGVECIIGAKRDPQFGPVLLFGAGGVLVELLREVSSALAPIDPRAAEELIASSRLAPLLSGFRGGKAADRAALAVLLVGVSRFVADNDDVVELDLNPVIVNQTGAHIADARLVVR